MRRIPLWALLVLVSPGLQAEARLATPTILGPVVAMAPGTLLVDARQAKAPGDPALPGALPYQAEMKLPPGMVVVIADDDNRAMQVASALAEKVPAQIIYALSGGAEAWQAIEQRQKGGPSAMRFNFVIPHNTCQQGKALQEFKSPGAKK